MSYPDIDIPSAHPHHLSKAAGFHEAMVIEPSGPTSCSENIFWGMRIERPAVRATARYVPTQIYGMLICTSTQGTRCVATQARTACYCSANTESGQEHGYESSIITGSCRLPVPKEIVCNQPWPPAPAQRLPKCVTRKDSFCSVGTLRLSIGNRAGLMQTEK